MRSTPRGGARLPASRRGAVPPSQHHVAAVLGGAVNRVDHSVEGDLLVQRGDLRFARDGGLEVGPLGPERGRERTLPADRAGRRDIGRHAVELLPHLERIHGSHALAAPEPDAEPLSLADVAPGDVEKGRDAVLAYDEGAAGLLHAAILTRPVEGGTYPLGLGP